MMYSSSKALQFAHFVHLLVLQLDLFTWSSVRERCTRVAGSRQVGCAQ